MITIWSPVVQVDLRYTVTITVAQYVVGQGMSLRAHIADGSTNAVAGIKADFYASTDGSTYSPIGTGAPSDGSGNSDFLWTGAEAYYYYFKATCTL